jgi:hypothetical protein
MGLKITESGPLEWHYIRTKFHGNLPTGSKVISGGQRDRQSGDLISLLSLFLESRLKSRSVFFSCGVQNVTTSLGPFSLIQSVPLV